MIRRIPAWQLRPGDILFRTRKRVRTTPYPIPGDRIAVLCEPVGSQPFCPNYLMAVEVVR